MSWNSECELDRFYELAKEYGSELAGPPECLCDKCSWAKLRDMQHELREYADLAMDIKNKSNQLMKRIDESCNRLIKIVKKRNEKEEKRQEAREVLGEKS
jgi:hypothetical protein